MSQVFRQSKRRGRYVYFDFEYLPLSRFRLLLTLVSQVRRRRDLGIFSVADRLTGYSRESSVQHCLTVRQNVPKPRRSKTGSKLVQKLLFKDSLSSFGRTLADHPTDQNGSFWVLRAANRKHGLREERRSLSRRLMIDTQKHKKRSSWSCQMTLL